MKEWDRRYGGTGGIVRATGSTFRNNNRDVGFMWYQNIQGGMEKPNLSYFHDCSFVSDDDYVGGRVEHVSLWGVRGIKFLGCNFENAQVLNPPVEARFLGRGIVAIDAAIEVDYFPGKRSTFKNLHEGIHMGCGPSNLYPSKVMNSDFVQCYRGIRNEGADLATIVGNHFTVGGNLAYMTDPMYDSNEEYLYQEGLVLHNASGFVVEQNTFGKHEATTTPIVGVRADATGGDENRIYKNSFEEVAFANLANRQNYYKDYSDPAFVPTGLAYWCNAQADNLYFDLAPTDPDPNDLFQIFTGIRPTQGRANLSAGNTFSHTSSLMSSDINNRAFFSDMRYWYFGNDNTGNNEYPAYITAGSVSIGQLTDNQFDNECPSNYTLPTEEDPIGGCPGCPNMTGLEDIFTANNTAFKTGKTSYNSLIDGGLTNTLLIYIDTTTNADTLVSKLSPHAPNLSTMVLDKIARNNVLDTVRKYLLIKANAEGVTNVILDHLDNRLHMPQWMLDSIAAARNNLTHRTYLLDTLMQYSAAREQAAFAALRLLAEDTAGLDLGSYRAWLDSLDTRWSYGQMVGTYVYEGRYDTLPELLAHYDSLLADPYDSLAFANLGRYLTDHAAWLAVDTSIMNLDSAHYAELLAQAGGTLHHQRGTQAARNVLGFFYDSLYFAPGMVPDIEFAKKEGGKETAVAEPERKLPKLPALNVYPNPAKDHLIVEYAFAEDQTLSVTDVYGREMLAQQIGAQATKVEINTTNFGSGMYFLRIGQGGKAVEKAKFNIMK